MLQLVRVCEQMMKVKGTDELKVYSNNGQDIATNLVGWKNEFTNLPFAYCLFVLNFRTFSVHVKLTVSD